MKRPMLVTLFFLTGCLGPRADQSTFYLLNSPLTLAEGPPLAVVLGLGPITVPGYLDRPQIVVRLSENEIALAESERWAEPLADNLARALGENLSKLLPTSSYVAYPWYESAAPDYGIALAVLRFEADATGAVVLDATWQLTAGHGVIDEGATLVEESAGGPDRTATVAAQSRALAELSRQIASAVRRAQGRAPGTHDR